MAICLRSIEEQDELEEKNEILEYKIELLTHAVLEMRELMKDSAGVYWSGPHQGMRQVGNLSLKRWYEMDENIPFLNEAIDILEKDQEDN